jgi:acyl-coenzyme A thioesterase PaaI-like protein
VSLDAGLAVATMRAVPWTRNHLGTVHAIAQCNLAEFAMGAVAEATVPSATHRWIPRGMSVEYLAKARGTLRAEATLTLPAALADQQELPVDITITDAAGKAVSRVEIRIWVTAVR